MVVLHICLSPRIQFSNDKGGIGLRQWIIATITLFTLILLIPALVVLAFGEKQSTPLSAEPKHVQARDEPIVEVAVYRSKEKRSNGFRLNNMSLAS